MKLWKSYQLLVLLLCVLWCVGVVYYLANPIDTTKEELDGQIDHYRDLLQDQIKKNNTLSWEISEKLVERWSGYRIENGYLEKKNYYQRQLDLYVRYGNTGEVDFPLERETPKTIQKIKQNIQTMWKWVDTLSSTTPHLQIMTIHNLTK